MIQQLEIIQIVIVQPGLRARQPLFSAVDTAPWWLPQLSTGLPAGAERSLNESESDENDPSLVSLVMRWDKVDESGPATPGQST